MSLTDGSEPRHQGKWPQLTGRTYDQQLLLSIEAKLHNMNVLLDRIVTLMEARQESFPMNGAPGGAV